MSKEKIDPNEIGKQFNNIFEDQSKDLYWVVFQAYGKNGMPILEDMEVRVNGPFYPPLVKEEIMRKHKSLSGARAIVLLEFTKLSPECNKLSYEYAKWLKMHEDQKAELLKRAAEGKLTEKERITLIENTDKRGEDEGKK